ncbi:LysR family transcriptional regulator [Pectobacterium actinidiae]|uniref:LysR family transcriptional regulator n=1 Tax=Pectobacterium actinidiae TaxID=1507808 RepID=UPI00381A5139
MDLLAGIQAFVQVAETRSFAAAARNLSLSASAVSKLIGRTEESVGAKLFHRNTRSISLTSEGVMFLGRCRCILDELDEARQELARVSEAPRGNLQLSLPNIGTFFLPVISGFTEVYPEIRLEIDFTDRLVHVIDEGFDVVVRTGRIADSRLTSRFLANYEMRLVGSPAYFARKPAPRSPLDLERHDCIQYRFHSSGKTEVWPLQMAEQHDFKLNESIICNSTEARMNLALMGKGIACLPDFMVQAHIDRGDLVSVLQQDLNWRGDFQLLWPSSRHRSPKLRAFIDYFSAHAFER